MNPRLQKPTMLCKPQITRGHPTPLGTVRLRRHVLIPGHQTTIPVNVRTTTRIEPTPFILRPVVPPSRSSCRERSFETSHIPSGTVSPRSAPVYGLKRRFLLPA